MLNRIHVDWKSIARMMGMLAPLSIGGSIGCWACRSTVMVKVGKSSSPNVVDHYDVTS